MLCAGSLFTTFQHCVRDLPDMPVLIAGSGFEIRRTLPVSDRRTCRGSTRPHPPVRVLQGIPDTLRRTRICNPCRRGDRMPPHLCILVPQEEGIGCLVRPDRSGHNDQSPSRSVRISFPTARSSPFRPGARAALRRTALSFSSSATIRDSAGAVPVLPVRWKPPNGPPRPGGISP
jgi:hypothetical protein